MLASIKKTGFRAKNKVQEKVTKYYGKTYRFARKHRWKLFVIAWILAIIIVAITLILVSLSGVDATNQAVVVNWTERRIWGGPYTNTFRLIGVNS